MVDGRFGLLQSTLKTRPSHRRNRRLAEVACFEKLQVFSPSLYPMTLLLTNANLIAADASCVSVRRLFASILAQPCYGDVRRGVCEGRHSRCDQAATACLRSLIVWFSAVFGLSLYGLIYSQKYSMAAGLVSEIVMTFIFLIVILGAAHKRAPVGFAGIAIGLALTLIHLISIPVTNTSVNPARSTGPAIFAGGWALQQLWLFWLAPIVGAALAGLTYRGLLEADQANLPPVTGRIEP